jgi:Tfp pilus assembly protein PilV
MSANNQGVAAVPACSTAVFLVFATGAIMIKNKRKFKTGFTLTEAVVAATLLLVALVPILKALTQANLNTVIIERRTQSLCLAQGKLNDIKARSIYNFDAISSQSNESLTGSYLCNTVIGGSGYLKTVSVSVGMDINKSGTLSSDETEVVLQSQIAKRQPTD